MKQLTKAEEQIMQVLWKHGALFLGDIVDAMPYPSRIKILWLQF